MKIKNLKRIIILSLLIAIIWVAQVMAYSFNMVVTPNTKNLKAGEEVTINIGLSNIDAGNLGINTVETLIEYDNEVFELVTQDNIKSLNNWSLTYKGEKNSGKILGIILTAGVKENQESIGTITLKTKAKISKKETEIKFSKITTNDGTELITDDDKEIKIQLEENDTQEVTTDVNNTVIAKKGEDINTNSKSIPTTGIKNIVIIAGMIVLIVTFLIYIYKLKIIK